LTINADAVAAYLAEQVRHGADALMIFDTWGGLLAPDAYLRFSLAYIERVLARLRAESGDRAPAIVFTKGGAQWLERIAACGCEAVGLDWTADIAAARAAVGKRVALQGNLDPLVLLTDPATIEREARAVLDAAGPAPGHIFNLGHGVLPTTPPENVAALVSCVHASRDRNGRLR
jgi:uroporphyrinogen decarboxylase